MSGRMEMFTRIFFVSALFLLSPAPTTSHAQEIRAKPGDTIEAVVRDKSDDVTVVEPTPTLVFLHEVEGQLLPVGDDGIAYGEAFVIELRFGQAQKESQLTVDLEWDDAEEPFRVTVKSVNGSDTLFWSDEWQMVYDGKARQGCYRVSSLSGRRAGPVLYSR